MRQERISSKPGAGTVRVALSGDEQMTGWTVDAATGIVTFDAAPANGVAVTAGFLFDVPVRFRDDKLAVAAEVFAAGVVTGRSEEHTSELQYLMRISYAVFCSKKKKKSVIS